MHSEKLTEALKPHGVFENEDELNHRYVEKIIKMQCSPHMGFGPLSQSLRPPCQATGRPAKIIGRPAKKMSNHGMRNFDGSAEHWYKLPLHTDYFLPTLNTVKRVDDEPCQTSKPQHWIYDCSFQYTNMTNMTNVKTQCTEPHGSDCRVATTRALARAPQHSVTHQ